jgi:DNA-binding response OmpR family regulator
VQICLVSDSEELAKTLSRNLSEVDMHAVQPATFRREEVSPDDERRLIEMLTSMDAVLFEWDVFHAAVLNVLYPRLAWSNVPLIALCSSDPHEQTMALLSGADMVLTLPLCVPLIKASVVAHHRTREAVRALAMSQVDRTRRAHRSEVTQSNPASPLDTGDEEDLGGKVLDLNAKTYECWIRGTEVNLTPRQFSLLHHLVQREGHVVTREEAIKQVWNLEFDPGTNIVDVHIHYLRSILEAHGLEDVIKTVRGKGYSYSLQA